MATYTLVFTKPDGSQTNSLTTWEDDVTAIKDVRTAVTGGDLVSIAIGRGADETNIEWLGVWSVNDAGGADWAPEE